MYRLRNRNYFRKRQRINPRLSEPTPIIISDNDSDTMSDDDVETAPFDYRKMNGIETAPFEDLKMKGVETAPFEDRKMKGLETLMSSCTLEGVPHNEPRRGKLRWNTREHGECSHALCSVCGESRTPREMSRGPHCDHRYCEACITGYVCGKVNDNIHRVKCPEPGCKKNLGHRFCSEYIDSLNLRNTWIDARALSKVLGKTTRVQCPFVECS